jgi:hypothetical protein
MLIPENEKNGSADEPMPWLSALILNTALLCFLALILTGTGVAIWKLIQWA